MILIGAWLIVIGYGLAYAGVSRVNGKPIGLRDAFSTQPTAASKPTAAQGATAADQQQYLIQQQESTVPQTVLA
jgi:hypothetical protein